MLDFFKDYKWDGRDWLILGKGPSFGNLDNHDISSYNTIGLNHVVRNKRVNLAHLIDIDVLDQLGEKFITNCDYVVMPYYPHLGWTPNPSITLDDISSRHPVLSKLRKEGRLFGYNLCTATQKFNRRWNDSPMVWASFFSAEAAVSLLGKLGVKKIRTLGIDGGIGQSEKFSDLQNVNTSGYDKQWQGIRKSIARFGFDYSVLGVESPIRIFIGAGSQQLIPALVLKHSILKHATMSVNVTIMNEWKHHMPLDHRNWPRTPFSFQRFMIPEKCDYKGHAIYMDSDMLVFGDVKEIWNRGESWKYAVYPMRFEDNDKHKAQFSVYWMNCESLGALGINIQSIINKLDSNDLTYERLVFGFEGMCALTEGHNPDWNSLEEYTEGKTKLLHYTEMYNQPWLRDWEHPLGYLWFNELKEAVADGSISKELVKYDVNNKWILPKCLEALNEQRIPTRTET